MITHNQRFIGIMAIVATLLFIPLIAMQFTEEVNWSPFDFMVAGGLLLGTGLVCELILRKIHRVSYRIVLCGILLIAFVLVWLELAVGIFGTPLAGS